MADYLESYAANFHLRVQTGVKVDRLAKEGDRFVVTAGVEVRGGKRGRSHGELSNPRRPEFAGISIPVSFNCIRTNIEPSQLQEGECLSSSGKLRGRHRHGGLAYAPGVDI
jgi:putative flavoprotein involved in K+ transport